MRIIFIPVNRSQVIPLLRDGYADLAYAGMTINEERKKQVDFSMPTITGLKEIIVGGPTSPKLNTLADLAGKELYLRAGSSYETAALKLSDSLKTSGIAAHHHQTCRSLSGIRRHAGNGQRRCYSILGNGRRCSPVMVKGHG